MLTLLPWLLAAILLWQARRLSRRLSDLERDARSQGWSLDERVRALQTEVESLQHHLRQLAVTGTLDAQAVAEGRLFAQARFVDLKAAMDTGEPLVVVDVREPHEWAAGHVPGALHLPLGSLQERAGEIPNSGGPIYVYCAMGSRSAAACDYLCRVEGRVEVINIADSVAAWPGPLET